MAGGIDCARRGNRRDPSSGTVTSFRFESGAQGVSSSAIRYSFDRVRMKQAAVGDDRRGHRELAERVAADDLERPPGADHVGGAVLAQREDRVVVGPWRRGERGADGDALPGVGLLAGARVVRGEEPAAEERVQHVAGEDLRRGCWGGGRRLRPRDELVGRLGTREGRCRGWRRRTAKTGGF